MLQLKVAIDDNSGGINIVIVGGGRWIKADRVGVMITIIFIKILNKIFNDIK